MVNIKEFNSLILSITGKKHILLGNGFSRAIKNDIFAYGSLFKRADFSQLSKFAKGNFEVLNTTNFEYVIRTLQNAECLAKHYETSDAVLCGKLNTDAEKIRKLLIDTIAQHHPSDPTEIGDANYKACRKFLSNFNNIYTVNYDLMLYWALLHQPDVGNETENFTLRPDDGFRNSDPPEEDFVTWDMTASHTQNVFYLHGALHLFMEYSELAKYTWTRTGVRLLEQIDKSLKSGKYPLFVAEGTAQQKRGQILRSAYLSKGLRSLAAIGGSLFVFGLSLSDNDEHILQAIADSKVLDLYVGLFGNPESFENQQVVAKANSVPAMRQQKRARLNVYFFDSANVKPWGTEETVVNKPLINKE